MSKPEPLPPDFDREASAARFWPKVDIRSDGECWPWKAARNKNGRGHFLLYTRHGQPRFTSCSRAAWLLTRGDVPPELQVGLRCDNPVCCNPTHLYLSTPKQRTAEMLRKDRQNPPRGSKSGRTPFSPEAVISIRTRYAEGSATAKELADEYDVRVGSIYRLVHGDRHSVTGGKLTPPGAKRKLAFEDAEAIRRLYAENAGTQREIGRAFGVGQEMVSAIIRGKVYRQRVSAE